MGSLCGSCARGPAAPLPLVTVLGFLGRVRRTEDARPLCRACARGAGTRALLATALGGFWGWPAAGRAAAAVVSDARALSRAGAFPRPLAALAAAAAFGLPTAFASALLLAVALAAGGSDPEAEARERAARIEELVAEARGYLAAGDAERALGRFRAALAEAPGLPELLAGAGLAASRSEGRSEEAERLLREALASGDLSRAGRADALATLGDVLLGTGRDAEAAEALAEALRIGPDAPVAVHVAYQDALRRSGRAAEATRIYEARVADRTADPDSLYLRARLLADPAAREAALRDVLARSPDHRRARYALARTLLEGTRPAEALPEFRAAALDRDGGDRALFGVIECALALGDRDGAARAAADLRLRFPASLLVARADALLDARGR
ncbi:MAG: tetratricopeptide repeat protein [Planctomycetales bacterium]|nr:tetratricopeptide repeat protein [Planctomycetales bacterium]